MAVAIEQDLVFHPGDCVGAGYVVDAVIGEGASGIVLRATDTRLERHVALKVLRARWSDGEDPWKLTEEARAMARVRHRNVVAVHALEIGAPAPHIVMEYIDGVDLAVWLESERILPIDVALAVLGQICEGVAATHAAGIVHYDLKPSNVLIDRGYRAVVTDFGLARAAAVAGHQLGGTPYYVAPEIVLETVESGYAPRADVYALGLMAVELITGQHPVRARDVQGIMSAKLSGALRPVSELRPELGNAFDDAVARAVAFDPHDRWEGPMDFWRAMQEARDRVATRAPRSRVIVVDADSDFRAFAIETLGQATGALVYGVATAGEAAEQIRSGKFDLMVLDPALPDMNGVELLATVREELQHEAPATLVASADANMDDWRLLSHLGAAGLVCKPVSPAQLVDAAGLAVPLRRAR